MFHDLDRFKWVNDTYGHRAGDELLKSVAQRLRRCVRQEDTVGRLAGDEFLVILDELASPVVAARVAAQILDALAEPVVIEGHELTINASIGVAVYPYGGRDAAELVGVQGKLIELCEKVGDRIGLERPGARAELDVQAHDAASVIRRGWVAACQESFWYRCARAR